MSSVDNCVMSTTARWKTGWSLVEKCDSVDVVVCGENHGDVLTLVDWFKSHNVVHKDCGVDADATGFQFYMWLKSPLVLSDHVKTLRVIT